MATRKQRQAARRNIRKAQRAWKSMTCRWRALAQPHGRQRPGALGSGGYYHIAVRPKQQFTTFRTQDVGKPGHVQRVAGKRPSGSWDTVKWLISKDDAHMEKGKLVGDTHEVRQVLSKLGSQPVHRQGDRFEARPRPNVPERMKPTAAQQRVRKANIRKAQAARRA
jgi:hypothetical protein